MKTKEILYVDVPFIGLFGGDKNRSKFLYDSLLENYETDILLIKNQKYPAHILKLHKKNDLYIIKSKKAAFYQPESLYGFEEQQISYFKDILLKNQYQTIIFKFNSTAVLANLAKKILPFSNIIIDVDMLSSRICYEAWTHNKSIKNRYYLIEYLKLLRFEKNFFKNDFTFLYTNQTEINLVKKKYLNNKAPNHKLLPNIFNEIKPLQHCEYPERFILFYGMLNSTVNETAYKFLIDEIYPFIEESLIEQNIKILVIGKNKTSIYDLAPQNVNVIGEVSDLGSYIRAAEFIFLPLIIASGTLTRILESSFLKKPVITTSIGAEGLNMDKYIFIEDNAKQFASKINLLLKDKILNKQMGQLAHNHVKKNHSKYQVSHIFNSIINNQKVKKINVVHIPRRFTQSHWGGTENVIVSYAQGLKKHNIHSEIYTTKILNTKKTEYIHGIKVNRFSYFYPYINLKNKIKEKLDFVGGNVFSFTLLFSLLFKKNIDLIHLHTAKRIGGIARFICKIRKIPYLISIHGGIYNRPEHKDINGPLSSNTCFEWGKVLGFLVGSRKVLNDSNGIICLNQDEYTIMRQKIQNNNILLIPNSVNISTFSKPKNNNLRDKYNISKDMFVCLVSGRIDRQKNQLLLLKVLNNIKYEHKNIHILLVGNITDNEYYYEIKEYIQSNSLDNYVNIVSNIKPESKELVDIYLNSDILVLPSVHEPFGIVVLEAWASSLPVIVSQTAGICNIIKDHEDALIFKNNSVKSLQQKLLTLIQDKKLQSLLIQNSQKTVSQFDSAIVNSKINLLYRQLLNQY